MRRSLAALSLSALSLAVAVIFSTAGITRAAGGLGHPTATAIGTFGGLRYIQYDGIFEGRSSTGAYRVPYRITAPADPDRGNRTVLVEPPHAFVGLGALDFGLGRDFLLGRGFADAGVGYSTTTFGEGADLRILDPTVPGVFINGGFIDENGRTDDEIVVDFARALSDDGEARSMLGRVQRRYLTGFSDSSDPVMRLITSGRADRVFDLAFPYTATGDPQTAITEGRYRGKLVVVNSEFEGSSADLVDRGVAPRQYRFYAVAGTPHIPDFLLPYPYFSSMTTPASFQPELRAAFLQGHHWVTDDVAPLPSTHLLSSDGVTPDQDANGNAISVDSRGRRVARLPFIELGEARFLTGFLGSYDQVMTIRTLGFKSTGQYREAFDTKLAEYVTAHRILKQDADAMRSRAALCSPLTFTETYRAHYDAFVALDPCAN